MEIITLPEERRELILNQLKENGKVLSIELSKLLNVSEDTIRRDLRELADANLLRRVHGGAMPINTAMESFRTRETLMVDVKINLAKKAVKLIKDHQTIFFGGGTTNLEIIKRIPKDFFLTIITPSVVNAIELANFPRIKTILIGGELSQKELTATGAEAVAQLKNFHTDLFFMGVCSLHHQHGITSVEYDGVISEKTMVENAKATVVPVSNHKLETISANFIAPISAISFLITEEDVDQKLLQPYFLQGIKIV